MDLQYCLPHLSRMLLLDVDASEIMVLCGYVFRLTWG